MLSEPPALSPTSRQPGRAPAPPPVSGKVVTTAILGTIILALGAFVLSFASLTDLAVRAGIPSSLGWIWPLIVDGLIVVSTVAIVALAGHGRRVLAYPWSLLAGGAGVSVAANASHAVLTSNASVPVVVSALVASVPPIVLLAVTHLAVILVQRAAPAGGEVVPVAPVPADLDFESFGDLDAFTDDDAHALLMSGARE